MKNYNKIYEMNEEELTAMYAEVTAQHEQAKAAYAAAATEEERREVMIQYPDYERGHMPKTPAMKAYEQLKRHVMTYSDAADEKLTKQFELVMLNSPDGSEWCYHTANQRQTRWIEAEYKIGQSAWWSYMYAKYVIQGRFPAGEESIRNEVKYAQRYDQYLARLQAITTEGEQ